MTVLQILLASASALGLGLALLLGRLLPARADAGDVMHRYSISGQRERTAEPVAAGELTDRVGLWAMKRIPAQVAFHTSPADLALLEIPVHEHYGKKVLYGVGGLLGVPLVTYFASVLGVKLPVLVPLLGSLAVGAYFFFSPDLSARSRAKEARRDFSRALAAFMELTALARQNGAGARQALEQAARAGDAWMFRRIQEALERSNWSGVTPWEALDELSQDLAMPELGEVGDIVRLSDEGSSVAKLLRERARSLRVAHQQDELGKANSADQNISFVTVGLVLVYCLILIAPNVLQILGL